MLLLCAANPDLFVSGRRALDSWFGSSFVRLRLSLFFGELKRVFSILNSRGGFSKATGEQVHRAIKVAGYQPRKLPEVSVQ